MSIEAVITVYLVLGLVWWVINDRGWPYVVGTLVGVALVVLSWPIYAGGKFGQWFHAKWKALPRG